VCEPACVHCIPTAVKAVEELHARSKGYSTSVRREVNETIKDTYMSSEEEDTYMLSD